VAGNVRELRNLVERLVIVARRRASNRIIFLRNFSAAFRKVCTNRMERFMKRAAPTSANLSWRKLQENRWNMTQTASALGLERSHLYRKMKSLGIAAPTSPMTSQPQSKTQNRARDSSPSSGVQTPENPRCSTAWSDRKLRSSRPNRKPLAIAFKASLRAPRDKSFLSIRPAFTKRNPRSINR